MRRCSAKATPARFASFHRTALFALVVAGLQSPAQAQDSRDILQPDLDRAASTLASLESSAGSVLLPDYVAYYKAASAFASGSFKDAAQIAASIAAVKPLSPLAGKAALLGARALVELNEGTAAAAILRANPQAPQPQSLLVLARAALVSGDRNSAANAFQKLYLTYPRSDEAKIAEDELARLKESMGTAFPPVTLSATADRAYKLLQGGDPARAKRELQELIPALGGAELEVARVRICEADYLTRQNTAAYTCLGALQVASPPADAERLYYLVQTARRLNRNDEIAGWIAALERYSASPWRLNALVAAGNEFLSDGEPEKAELYYASCASGFAADPQGAVCHWRIAWGAWMRRDPNAAALMMEHATRYPESDKAGAALYFAGKYAPLLQKYPNSYYAMLARRKGTSALANPVPLTWTASPVTSARLERARVLANAGLEDLAEAELRFAAKNDVGIQANLIALELGEIATKAGAPERGVRHIKAVFPDYLYLPYASAPDRFWRLIFPLPYRDAVERYSRARELDPFVLAGLIRQESEFDPKAVSRARAYGLSQVLPSTARMMAKKVGVTRFRSAMLFDPETNLRFGTSILRQYLDQYEGNLEAALASYNGGPNRVRRWLDAYAYREPAEFIESIPLTETRNYVQLVLRNAEIYRFLYGKGGRG